MALMYTANDFRALNKYSSTDELFDDIEDNFSILFEECLKSVESAKFDHGNPNLKPLRFG